MNSVSIERNQPLKSNAILTGFAGLYALAALCFTVFSLYLTLILHWQGAFRDLWEFVDDIEQQFSGTWSTAYLLDAYGGAHRIFLPKLLFFADYYWFGGRNDLATVVALLCQISYGLLIWRATRSPLLPHNERIIFTSLFVLALFSATQVSNFLYAMDVQWYMSNLLGIISLYTLAFCKKSTQKWLLVIFFGTAAALCNFTGMMPLLIAALTLILQRNRQPIHFCLLFIIGAICFFYVHNDKNSTHVVISALQHSNDIKLSLGIISNTLVDMAIYVPRYLSSPLSREWPIAGYALAITGISMTTYYWLRFYLHQHTLSHWQKLCLYLSTGIIISAIFTAFGRVIYPNSATAERYQTLVLPWLPSLFCLAWIDLRALRHNAIFLVIGTLIFSCYLLPSQLSSAKSMVVLSSRVQQAHTAARAGVLEPPYILATLSHPLIKNKINSVKDNDAFLRSHILGYFQYLPEFALGNQLPVTAIPSCIGHASATLDNKANAWIINGQLLINDHQAATDVVIAQQNIIRGLGILVGADDSLLPASQQNAQQSRFRAFAHEKNLETNKPITLFGIRNGIVQCQMPLQITTP